MEDQKELITKQQNRAVHRAFREIAYELDMAGYDMRSVKIRIIPTEEGVKENFFKPIMSAMYPGLESTTELTAEQFSRCWQVFNDAVQDKFGVYVSLDGQDDDGLWN